MKPFSARHARQDWARAFTFWGGVDQQARFLRLGANLLIHSADITLFQKHLRDELKAVKQAAGLISTKSNAQSEINI